MRFLYWLMFVAGAGIEVYGVGVFTVGSFFTTWPPEDWSMFYGYLVTIFITLQVMAWVTLLRWGFLFVLELLHGPAASEGSESL